MCAYHRSDAAITQIFRAWDSNHRPPGMKSAVFTIKLLSSDGSGCLHLLIFFPQELLYNIFCQEKQMFSSLST